MPRFFSRLLRFILRAVMWAFAAVFALSLLLAALVVLVVGLLKALITGQKPQPLAFSVRRFDRFTTRTPSSAGASRATGAPATADVVDVEVREIRSDQRLP